MQEVAETYNLLHSSTEGHKLTTIDGYFNLALAFQEVLDRNLIPQMEDSCSRPSYSQTMHQVCINKYRDTNRFSFGKR